MAFADYAPARANDQSTQRRGPSPWVTALLTALTPGLGHLYIGQARRGITLFLLIMIADMLLMFAMMGVLARVSDARLSAPSLQPMDDLRGRVRARLPHLRGALYLCRPCQVVGPAVVVERHHPQHGTHAADG